MSNDGDCAQLKAAFGEAPSLSFSAAGVEAFASRNVARGRRLALVTSGGTTAPLEHTGVRFIDNFSTGKRGSAIAENLLSGNGDDGTSYAVVFLVRKGGLTPFMRRFRQIEEQGLKKCFSFDQSGGVVVQSEGLQRDLKARRKVEEDDKLLLIEYTTVQEYLFSLRSISLILHRSASKGTLILLAAAVSDFYVPLNEMPFHKIQSREGKLTLHLAQTPKCLGDLRTSWAPFAFIVSFKLETDDNILLQKAQRAIDLYKVDMVLANELTSRYRMVKLVTATDVRVLELVEGHNDLDDLFMSEIIKSHSDHIAKCAEHTRRPS